MSEFYRARLDCGCCAEVRVVSYPKDPNLYCYTVNIDYMPNHIHQEISIEGDLIPPFGEALNVGCVLGAVSRRVPCHELRTPDAGRDGAYPRVWRPGLALPDIFQPGYIEATTAFVSLQSDLIDLFRTIEPDITNVNTSGHRVRELLILACTEVETLWKDVLRENGYIKERYTTNDYIKVRDILKLDQFRVSLRRYPDYAIHPPFAGWSESSPTKTLGQDGAADTGWYEAYNQTKHDRSKHLCTASFHHVVEAMAAIYILLGAEFGVGLSSKVNGEDFEERRVFEFEDIPEFPAQEHYFISDIAPEPNVVRHPDLDMGCSP